MSFAMNSLVNDKAEYTPAAAAGPVCDATLRTRPVWGDLAQLLLERDSVLFSVGVE